MSPVLAAGQEEEVPTKRRRAGGPCRRLRVWADPAARVFVVQCRGLFDSALPSLVAHHLHVSGGPKSTCQHVCLHAGDDPRTVVCGGCWLVEVEDSRLRGIDPRNPRRNEIFNQNFDSYRLAAKRGTRHRAGGGGDYRPAVSPGAMSSEPEGAAGTRRRLKLHVCLRFCAALRVATAPVPKTVMSGGASAVGLRCYIGEDNAYWQLLRC